MLHLNFIYISPSNILQIYASFQSYFLKYDRSRRNLSDTSPGMNGLMVQFRAMMRLAGLIMGYNEAEM